MNAPEPSDPQDAIVAEEYLKDRQKFNKTAEQWTKQHAMKGRGDRDFLTVQPKVKFWFEMCEWKLYLNKFEILFSIF